MFLLNQTTLRQKVVFSGIGLHSGQPTSLIIHPAPENTGIQFVKDGIFIPAIVSSVKGTAFATQLHYNGASVRTVEHFLKRFKNFKKFKTVKCSKLFRLFQLKLLWWASRALKLKI